MKAPPMKITDTPSIERLKELLAKATPGELRLVSTEKEHAPGWFWHELMMEGREQPLGELFEDDSDKGGAFGSQFDPQTIYIAELIVEAINALPHLIAALETLTPSEIRREALEEAAKVADDFARYATEKGRPEKASLASLIAADIRTLPDREATRSLAKEDGRP